MLEAQKHAVVVVGALEFILGLAERLGLMWVRATSRRSPMASSVL